MQLQNVFLLLPQKGQLEFLWREGWSVRPGNLEIFIKLNINLEFPERWKEGLKKSLLWGRLDIFFQLAHSPISDKRKCITGSRHSKGLFVLHSRHWDTIYSRYSSHRSSGCRQVNTLL